MHKRPPVVLGLISLWLVSSAAASVTPSTPVTPSCATIVSRPEIEAFFPSGSRIVSLFAGRLGLEARLATTLGTTIDAVDILRPREIPPGVRFIQRDLRDTSLGPVGQYDRVVMWSPWFTPRRIPIMNPEFVNPTLPFSPRDSTFAQAAFERLCAAPLEGFTMRYHDLTPERAREYFAQYHNRETARERLGMLYEAVALARDHLAPGGTAYLVTELFHTLALSDPPGPGLISNFLLEWPVHTTEATRMLGEGFPGVAIRRNPGALRSLLLPEGASMDNSWGNNVAEVWAIRNLAGRR